MTVIPGLPDHLMVVPPAPLSPDDPERDEKRAAWHAWKDALIVDNDDYQQLLERNPSLIADELILCAAHPAYWLARWGTIFEPRPDDDRGDESPFIPFASQVDLLDFFMDCLKARGAKGDAAVSKSRDMGASWVMCAFAAWGWLFARPWQVRLISYAEPLVDEGYQANPDSLFWKIDYLFDRLPPWMMPKGYDPSLGSCRKKLTIKNPQNGNLIGGMSSTSKAGRGRRSTWIGFDEFAIFENGDEAWSGTTNATNHRFAVSSEHIEYGDHFQRLQGINQEVGAVTVSQFPMDWWLSPHHGDQWYEETKERFRAEGRLDAFYREVGRDVHHGSRTWVYESAKKKAPDASIVYVPGSPLYGSADPGKRDQCFLLWAQENLKTGELEILDGYEQNGQPADYYGTIITGVAESQGWVYDDDALRIMNWTKHLPGATWFGDTYGKHQEAATLDSVYGRWQKYGIYVNVDRTPEGDLTADKRQARTFRGRKEAADEYLPRTRFANTPGARKVLAALQNARYKPEDGKTTTEQSEPMHDWTSHARTAYEFLCVHLKMRKQIASRAARPATRSSRYQPVNQPRWNSTQDLPQLRGLPR